MRAPAVKHLKLLMDEIFKNVSCYCCWLLFSFLFIEIDNLFCFHVM